MILHKIIVSPMISRHGADERRLSGFPSIQPGEFVRSRKLKEEEGETAKRSDRMHE